MSDEWIIVIGLAAGIVFAYLLLVDGALHPRLRRLCKKDKDGNYLTECGTYEYTSKKACINCGSRDIVRTISDDMYGNRHISFECKRCGEQIHRTKAYKRR